MGGPPAQVVATEEAGLLAVGGVPPDPAAHEVNKEGTYRDVTQQLFSLISYFSPLHQGSDLDNPVDPHGRVMSCSLSFPPVTPSTQKWQLLCYREPSCGSVRLSS